MLNEYAVNMPAFTAEESRVWGRLRVGNHENALDRWLQKVKIL